MKIEANCLGHERILTIGLRVGREHVYVLCICVCVCISVDNVPK